MGTITGGLRRLAALAGIVALAGLLSACVLSSATNLVTDDEAVTPLPASFSMYGYKEADGAYAAPDEAPGSFTQSGRTYVGGSAGEGQMTVRFTPLDADTYIVSVTSTDPGALYGVARFKGGILELRMIFGDGIEAALNAAKLEAPPAIAEDLVYEDGGVTVSRPETLRYAAGLILGGKLPADPLVAWISGDAAAPPPPRIVPDGDWYHVED